jgi:serine/threonine protein phosphatase PrpC/pSer/pThr/pTyr-binding forkhead associated (FHA) protein
VATNDFVINDTEVSSQHARIAWDDAQHVWQLVRIPSCSRASGVGAQPEKTLPGQKSPPQGCCFNRYHRSHVHCNMARSQMDLGSLNGTRLNGSGVGKPNRECGTWHSLRHGDEIHFGERDESPSVFVALLPAPEGSDAAQGRNESLGVRVSTSANGIEAAESQVTTTRRLPALISAGGLTTGVPPPYSALLPPPSHALRLPVAVRQDPARGRPCEDRSVVEFPLRGHPDCALLCVLDGHCGAGAAQQASDLLPGFIAKELAQLPLGWRTSATGAAPALRAAFLATDAALNCEYEGCAATAVLMWREVDTGAAEPQSNPPLPKPHVKTGTGRLMVQAANVGDCMAVLCASTAVWLGPLDDADPASSSSNGSAPLPLPPPSAVMPQTPPLVLNGSSLPISPRSSASGSGGVPSPLMDALNRSHTALVLTQDHKVATPHERERLRARGVQLKPTENRLYGLALARALGDHFLKKSDVACGLVAEPFVSRVAVVDAAADSAFVVCATDGLWDVTGPSGAVQMAAVAGAGGPGGAAGCDAAAAALLAHARQKRSKDDVTVLAIALHGQ